ncbi:HAL/PAL/TAL family ammonia-lyase [Nakamurella sp.]|uniref:HAL/PAL/TAL family ammonia-lyase n=1 Tax=Nakamurella sp. TaxID=1869182 RepID=UPI003B3AD346
MSSPVSLEPIVLGSDPTSIADIAAIAHGAPVVLDERAVRAIDRTHRLLPTVLRSGSPVYGLNTGVGDLYTTVPDSRDPAAVQLQMLRSHASGVGDPHDEAAVRAIMACTIRSLARGYSGVSVRLVQTLVDMLNRGVVPYAPSQGSVGYLTATAHIGLAVFGEGQAWYRGDLLAGAEALRRAGIAGQEPGLREGLALISGTFEISGIGALAVNKVQTLIDVADVAGAMSVEALRGNTRGFDARLQALRPHPGQVLTARRLRALLAGSEIVETYRRHRLQDPLSLRCIPQVHGAVRDCLAYVAGVVECEINSVTDNPVFVTIDGPDGPELQALSGGNGHGAPIATALDCLAIATAELSTMSQARSDRLTNSHLSELPPFLVAGSGAGSGFMIPPYVAAALAAENRAHAAPATVHTVSTCAGQEDHVSMGTTAAIKARRAAWNAGHILAVELLCAAQALDFHAPLRPGVGTGAAHAAIRRLVPTRVADDPIGPDLEAVRALVQDGTLAGLVDARLDPDALGPAADALAAAPAG